jgi:hypothetical protein
VHRQVELFRVNFVFADSAIFQLANQRLAGDGDFVQPFATENGQRPRAAQALQDTHLDADEVGVEDAHDLLRRVGRVGQRAEDVENGPHAQFAAHRRGVLHRAVVVGREHEADAGFGDALRDLRRIQVDIGAERFEHVGAARLD